MFVFYFAAKGQRSVIHGILSARSLLQVSPYWKFGAGKRVPVFAVLWVIHPKKKFIVHLLWREQGLLFARIFFLSKLSHWKWLFNHWWQNAKYGFDEYMQTSWILANWVKLMRQQLRSKELLTDAYFIARYDRETSMYLLVTFYQAHLITANFYWMLYCSIILWNAPWFFLRYGAVFIRDDSESSYTILFVVIEVAQ